MVPGSTDPECEAVTAMDWWGGGEWWDRLREEERWIGRHSPSLVLPFYSHCHFWALPQPQHALSHLFYLLLLPQHTHSSPVCWLERPAASLWGCPTVPFHSFLQSPTLTLCICGSLCLPPIFLYVIHLVLFNRRKLCCLTLGQTRQKEMQILNLSVTHLNHIL